MVLQCIFIGSAEKGNTKVTIKKIEITIVINDTGGLQFNSADGK